MAHHYQCAGCFCTLSLGAAASNEPLYSIANGDFCSSCQAQEMRATTMMMIKVGQRGQLHFRLVKH